MSIAKANMSDVHATQYYKDLEALFGVRVGDWNRKPCKPSSTKTNTLEPVVSYY